MTAGRPTKYKEEFVDKVEEYLQQCQDEYYDYKKSWSSSSKGESGSQEQKIKVKLPTIEGFARFLGVNKTTIYEWIKEHNKFSNAIEAIQVEQQQRLLNKGLSGDYNQTIAKLILSSNHGMVERQDVTSQDEKIEGNIIHFDNGEG